MVVSHDLIDITRARSSSDCLKQPVRSRSIVLGGSVMKRPAMVLVLATFACGAPSDGADGGRLDAARDADTTPCARDEDCSNAEFCDGVERCDPGGAGVDAR